MANKIIKMSPIPFIVGLNDLYVGTSENEGSPARPIAVR
jgi:hypothetical protein